MMIAIVNTLSRMLAVPPRAVDDPSALDEPADPDAVLHGGRRLLGLEHERHHVGDLDPGDAGCDVLPPVIWSNVCSGLLHTPGVSDESPSA
jgi:hypothetical protein